MTKKYRVTFDSGDENYFRVHIGDDIVKFAANYYRFRISKPDNNFFRKLAEDLKKEYY